MKHWNTGTVMLWQSFGTPTAFSLPAQGCVVRATLGVGWILATTLKGLHRASPRVLQPLQGFARFAFALRVASQARQPWAVLQNAVGVQLTVALLGDWWLLMGSASTKPNGCPAVTND